MKRSLFVVLFISIAVSAFAAEMKYGSLNVFSKMAGTNIYVDGELKGSDNAQLKEVQAGTHFVKVTTGETTTEVTIYAEVVNVEPGEVTTVYVSEKGYEDTIKTPQAPQEVDVFRTKRVLDYSKELHTGWYLKLSYLTNYYYSLETPTLNNYASTFGLGLGFKIPLATGIDLSLEMERSELNTSKDRWFFMPITANLQLSYLPSPYFRGKQYYGLGIGYYMTNLENSLKQNLTAIGYHLFYGLEMPAGDMSAFFFEFGYHMADISRYNYSLNGAYASAGYRWDIK